MAQNISSASTQVSSCRASAASLTAALELARAGGPDEIVPDEIVIGGGGEIYAQALPLADAMRLTWVEAEPEGDALFPDIDAGAWRETAREQHPVEDGRPAFAFVDYIRA